MLSLLANIMKSSQPKKEAERPPAPDISSLLGLLGMNSQTGKQSSENTSGVFGSKEEMKNRISLLNAVKPYLSEERKDKLESVVKLLKLTELGELSALLGKL